MTHYYSRSVMIKCWENLLHLEIIRPVDKSSRIQNEYRPCALNVMASEVQSAVEANKNVFIAVKEWAKTKVLEA